jgi:hypothetical protein
MLELSGSHSRVGALRAKDIPAKIRKASSWQRRVIPADAELGAWPDQLEPLRQ